MKEYFAFDYIGRSVDRLIYWFLLLKLKPCRTSELIALRLHKSSVLKSFVDFRRKSDMQHSLFWRPCRKKAEKEIMRKMCKSCFSACTRKEERTEHKLLDSYIIIALLRTKLAPRKRNLRNANRPRGTEKVQRSKEKPYCFGFVSLRNLSFTNDLEFLFRMTMSSRNEMQRK